MSVPDHLKVMGVTEIGYCADGSWWVAGYIDVDTIERGWGWAQRDKIVRHAERMLSIRPA